jgi:nicotinate-nucleotide pyrophosphorylase (carboxylating)
VCGLDVFTRVFSLLEEGVVAQPHARDGDAVRPGDRLLDITGAARTLLVGERTALNFLQRMSGIATLAHAFVQATDHGVRILDTRKTTPGLRAFEKYAVRCGGAENHRFGLFDEAMIKNNHVDLAGATMGTMIGRLRSLHGPELRITAEARDEMEALTAVQGGADVVMLDNMSIPAMQALCPRLRALADEAGRRIEIEASGNVTLERAADFVESGVDRVSVGALTHSYDALDLSFRIEVLP